MNNRQRRDSKRDNSGGGPRRNSRSRSPRRNRGGNNQNGAGGQNVNNRMVYITNIPYDVRWVELKSLVREKGGEVVFCELLEDRNGKPKGNAVVEFETRQAAENCVNNLQKFEFKGRNLVAKEIRDPVAFFRTIKNETGIDYLARAGGSGQRGGGGGGVSGGGGGHGGPVGNAGPPGSHKDDRQVTRSGTYELFGLNMDFLRQLNIEPPICERIFVANLAFNVGTEKIYEVFGMAGKITWMDFRIDKEGKSKGVCVIQYTHPIEAVQAISMFHNQRLYDRSLVVKMDRFDKIDNEAKDGALPRGLESIGMGLGADGAPLANVSSVFGGSGIAGGPNEPVPTAQMFAPPVQPTPLISGGGPSGYGAPSLSGGGSSGGGIDNVSYRGSLLGNGSFGGAANSSYHSNDPMYSSASGGKVILITNLPTDYTWQIVRDRVRQFGDVETVDMIAPGAARVRFGSFSDAERTRTALYRTTVEGRPINVEFV